MDIKAKITEWLAPELLERNLFLVEIKQVAGIKLEIYIDGDNGITIGQCAEISRYLEKHLDESELIAENYSLDVSSPGMSNPLVIPRQYFKRIGQKLELVKIDGTALEVELLAANDEQIQVKNIGKKLSKTQEKKLGEKAKTDLNPYEIKYADIKKALIKIDWK